jgi:hypothetical protein
VAVILDTNAVSALFAGDLLSDNFSIPSHCIIFP